MTACIFFLSCNALQRLSEGCRVSFLRIYVCMLVTALSFSPSITHAPLSIFSWRISRHTSCSAAVRSGKSVSISSIPASCKTSYSLTLVTTFCCISSPTILSRAFVLSKLCLSEDSSVYALTCSFSCPNISKNSSSSFFRNVFS